MTVISNSSGFTPGTEADTTKSSGVSCRSIGKVLVPAPSAGQAGGRTKLSSNSLFIISRTDTNSPTGSHLVTVRIFISSFG